MLHHQQGILLPTVPALSTVRYPHTVVPTTIYITGTTSVELVLVNVPAPPRKANEHVEPQILLQSRRYAPGGLLRNKKRIHIRIPMLLFRRLLSTILVLDPLCFAIIENIIWQRSHHFNGIHSRIVGCFRSNNKKNGETKTALNIKAAIH